MSLAFNPEYWFIWAIGLSGALWFPMRQLIWTISARRVLKKKALLNDDLSEQLRRRASITSLLISMFFAVFYTWYLFKN